MHRHCANVYPSQLEESDLCWKFVSTRFGLLLHMVGHSLMEVGEGGAWIQFPTCRPRPKKLGFLLSRLPRSKQLRSAFKIPAARVWSSVGNGVAGWANTAAWDGKLNMEALLWQAWRLPGRESYREPNQNSPVVNFFCTSERWAVFRIGRQIIFLIRFKVESIRKGCRPKILKKAFNIQTQWNEYNTF